MSLNSRSRLPIETAGSPALSKMSTVHWLLAPLPGTVGLNWNVSEFALPRLSKYSTGRL